jgi:hypothetical protein
MVGLFDTRFMIPLVPYHRRRRLAVNDDRSPGNDSAQQTTETWADAAGATVSALVALPSRTSAM